MNFEISKNGYPHSEKSSQTVARPVDFIEVNKPFDLRTAIQLLLEKWPLLLKVSFVAATVAAGFALFMPEKYQAKAVLQVDQQEQGLFGGDAAPIDLRAPEVLNTIVENVRNSSVLRRVIHENQLVNDRNFLPKLRQPRTEEKLITAFRKMITVKLRPETRLVDIMVSHSNPKLAQKLANSVAESYIRQNLYDHFTTSKAANGMLYEEAERLKAKLEKSEAEIQAYKEKTKIVSIEDRQNVLVEKLRELSKSYTEAQTKRLDLQANLAQIRTSTTNPAAVLALGTVQNDPFVAELRKKLLDQEALVASMKAQYQPTFPKLQRAIEELAELQKVLQGFAEKVESSMRFTYDAAVAREKNIEEALREAQTEALTLDKKAVGYNVRFRELQSDRALYDSVLKRLKETDLSKGLGQASLSLVESASSPLPQNLSPIVIIPGVFLLTFFGAAVVLYFVRSAKGFIYTVDDAEHSLGVPVWAAIPSIENGRTKGLPHVLTQDPDSFCAEGFRMLRASAGNAPVSSEKKIFVFTSADPGEGKTFCSLNYAICQAEEGKRTLLIDLDLRKPSIGKNFDLSNNSLGVTDYLVHGMLLRDLCQGTSYPQLYVLSAGKKIPNPAEQLAKGSLLDLLSEASVQFDRIVIDTAPMNAVSDTFLILPFADIVCLVVRSGKTSQRAVKRAMELMFRANIPPAGIVLNYLPAKRGYGYYYHYGSDYKYGNGERPETSTPTTLLNSTSAASNRD